MVYDFAIQLKQMGHEVDVACFEYDFPMRSCFEPAGVKVYSDIDESPTKNYDLVISFHSFYLKCLLKNGLVANKFVYFCLSPYEEFETPLGQESHFFSLGFFNSKESLDYHVENSGVLADNSLVFPNSVQDTFFDAFNIRSGSLKKICVVTNHAPDEVKALNNILRQQKIEVVFIGRFHSGIARFIEPATIKSFDLIITIGRTVQYAMALGVPVYIYDRFGGPGYLTEDNFEKEFELNFSGRSHQVKLDAKALARDILTNYSRKNTEIFNQKAQELFGLKNNLTNLIVRVEKLSQTKLKDIKIFSYDAPVYKKLLLKNKSLEKRLKIQDRREKLNYSMQREDRDAMKLSVSYNFFNGEEYFYQSAFNMRGLAEHISIVYQEVSNCGEPISLSAKKILHKIVRNGLADEVVLFEPDLNLSPSENEFKKRKLGERLARENGCTHFLSMDADEFYERSKFQKIKKYILKNDISYSSCNSYFYLKKPIYRSKELDTTKVAFICRLDAHTEFCRAGYFPVTPVDPTRRITNSLGRFMHFEESDIVMHHMNFIRKDNFKSKLKNSSNANKTEFMGNLFASLEKWCFGQLFEFPNKGEYEIVEVENLFSLPFLNENK